MKTKILLILLFLFSTNLLAYDKFVDPNPGDNDFGRDIIPLPSGNVLISAPRTKVDSINSGAVYLFNGKTGALISALYGTSDYNFSSNYNNAYDNCYLLPNGNILLRSREWRDNSKKYRGALTLINGVTGLNGYIDSTNSLIGFNDGNNLNVVVLKNGNYIVLGFYKDRSNGDFTSCAIFRRINDPLTGCLDEYEGMIKRGTNETCASMNAIELKTGNYLIETNQIDTNRNYTRSFTLCNGESGTTGEIDEKNSFFISGINQDSWFYDLIQLPNSNFLIYTHTWGGINKGTITFFDATNPTVGRLNDTNSVIDCTIYTYIKVLSNSNYVISISDLYNDYNPEFYGAVAWCDGTKGRSGRILPNNSLFGISGKSKLSDNTIALPNGNYLVRSLIYDIDNDEDRFCLTWCDGTKGLIGIVDSTNSFMNAKDNIMLLKNGNYIVTTAGVYNTTNPKPTLITLCDANKGLTGNASEKNSFQIDVIQTPDMRMLELTNGNILLSLPYWNGGMGAWKIFEKNEQFIGKLDTASCLKGIYPKFAYSSFIRPLKSGNFLIDCPIGSSGNGQTVWCDGSKPLSGYIDNTKSYLGRLLDITELKNGNYLMRGVYNNNKNAITFCKKDEPFYGEPNDTNSLVGASVGDDIGEEVINHYNTWLEYKNRMYPLKNGNYMIYSPHFRDSNNKQIGAITYGNGETGVSGIVGTSNSLIGIDSTKKLESDFYYFDNGNFLIFNPKYDNYKGSITLVDKNGINGNINESNSLVGTDIGDQLGYNGLYSTFTSNSDSKYFLTVNCNYGCAFKKARGCVSLGDDINGLRGTISERNSLIAPYFETSDCYENGIHRVVIDSTNKLIYIGFKTEHFVHVLGFDNKLEVLNTKPQTKDVKISPNPCSDYINVEFDLEDFAGITLDVLSYDGRLIKSDYLGYKLAGKININKNISDLPTGNYFLRLKYNDVSAVKTFSVVR